MSALALVDISISVDRYCLVDHPGEGHNLLWWLGKQTQHSPSVGIVIAVAPRRISPAGR